MGTQITSQSGSGEPAPKRRRYLWGFVLLGIVLPLGIIYALLGYSDQLRDDAILAIGASVVASATWWSFFARYAEREARWLLTNELARQREVLEGELSGLVREVERESRKARDNSLPHAIYPSTDKFDLRYNHDLTEDLESSTFYYFSGPSAVWVPARLQLRRENSTRLGEVRVRVVDPSSQIAMKRAVLDRKRRLENEQKSSEKIEAELRDHLVLLHVGLWRARSSVHGRICISYESRSILQRLELFESRIYDSSIDREDKERYPRSAARSSRHPSWTVEYEGFLADGFTVFAIDQTTTQKTLEAHLREMGLDHDNFDYWVERYEVEYLARMTKVLELAHDHKDEVLVEKQLVKALQ